MIPVKLHQSKRLFVVAGMHRSGTSAITRGLQVFGIPLGDKLFPSGYDNPKGFWEDRDTLNLNEELLTTLGAAYDSLGLINKIDLNDVSIQRLFQQAVALINDKLEQNNGLFGFKDPRTSRLLPFWKEVFRTCECEVNYILATRNPLSIAQSLSSRNNFEIEKSYLLWLEHVIEGISETTHCNRIFVDYDNLMTDAGKELQKIALAFQLEIDPGELAIFVTEFLDQELRHSQYKESDIHNNDSVPQMVRDVYKTLNGLTETMEFDDADIRIKTEKWKQELNLLAPALDLADKLFNQLSAQNEILKEPKPNGLSTSQPSNSIPGVETPSIAELIQKQVSSDHYQGTSYNKKPRFCSYWHQIDEVCKQKPQTILEIGVGNGFVSDFLRKAGFNVSTLDLDPNLNPTILGSVLDIPLPERSFDLALCCQVLEHLPYESFIPALEQLHRVVNTSLILSLPDMKPVSRIHFKSPKARIDLLVPHFYTNPIDWEFDGQHYWNIGNKNYPLKRIMDDIKKANFKITRHFRVPENPGHHFFILERNFIEIRHESR